MDTPGGRLYAEWDSQAPMTREGQLVFFFQFLEAGERWREFLADCPLSNVGNRGSGKHGVPTPLTIPLTRLDENYFSRWFPNTGF